jgi:hypothetical protein
MCGSDAKMDATSAAECYGRAWQNLWIECTKNKDPHCGMELNLNADFFGIDNADDVITEAWNRLTRK